MTLSGSDPSALAPEWRSWLAENLARGVEPEALARLLERAGVPLALVRLELQRAMRHPALRAARSLSTRHARLEALLESYRRLYRQSGAHRHLERRRALSPEEFFERYYFRNRPVVLQGLLEDWPARTRWSPEFFAERFGDCLVEVMTGRESEPEDHDFRVAPHRTKMTMRDYVTRVRSAGETNDFYMIARNVVLNEPAFRPLLEDIRPPAGLIHPELGMPDSMHLWFGPAGTLSNLHHDHLNVLFCQLHGRKRFWLMPSFELSRAYNHRGLSSEVDIRAPALERFPAFGEASLVELVLEPGEVLLIPVGWWHAVKALDVSISLTFVSFALPERNTLWKNFWLGPVPEDG
ncbi:cupin-like domain-containing protein [Archangium violaceum]|uniref:cupin-like domain-containing protein n=1 Tax=Archangium violaceum TaxID=83451 RepID=UPI00193AF995|nr:cupin-like domain-containing protein [Archangium violaceum]QRK09342.1 cupin-like domain-containing protein [Archangium violaceum]